jgi:hypothetical protein
MMDAGKAQTLPTAYMRMIAMSEVTRLLRVKSPTDK